MKYLPLILFIATFAVSAEPTDCVQKSKENYKSEKAACGTLFGVENSNCIETAKEKLRAANLDCKAKLVDCISKASAAKNDSKILSTRVLFVSLPNTLFTITFNTDGWSTTIFQDKVPDLDVFL